MGKNKQNRPLLKNPPLPQAGESLRNTFIEVVYNKVLFWLVLSFIFILLAGLSWYSYLTGIELDRYTASVMAVLFCIIAGFKIRQAFPEIRRLRQGEMGERVVGERLEDLRADGYRVFHDISEDGYNIDHIIIGPGGIFVIETKMFRKPPPGNGTPKVVFDGKQVLVNGSAPERDPIVQANANAGTINDILTRSTSRKPIIRPVVLFAEWYVEQPKDVKVWVLNEKAFRSWVRKSKPVLSADDVSIFSELLTNHIRTRCG